MKTYILSMTVETTHEFENDAAAIEYIKNHTVFDLLDRNAEVLEPRVVCVDDGWTIYED